MDIALLTTLLIQRLLRYGTMIDATTPVTDDIGSRVERDVLDTSVNQIAADAREGRYSALVESIKLVMPQIEALVDLSETLPAKYREVAFREFLRLVLPGPALDAASRERTAGSLKSNPSGSAIGFSLNDAPLDAPGIHRVEAALNVPAGSLSRVVQIDDDKAVHVLARIEGRSTKERQLRIAQIVCFVREKAFNEMKTDVEAIRAVCIAQGVYDPANFAAHLRRDPSVNEATTPGSKEKFLVLSRDGVEAATDLLRELAGH